MYVHRSGRTARANQTGTAVSFVSPEDMSHHRDICSYLGVKNLSPLSIYPHSLPLLRQRVKLAKQVSIFLFLCLHLMHICVFTTYIPEISVFIIIHSLSMYIDISAIINIITNSKR